MAKITIIDDSNERYDPDDVTVDKEALNGVKVSIGHRHLPDGMLSWSPRQYHGYMAVLTSDTTGTVSGTITASERKHAKDELFISVNTGP